MNLEGEVRSENNNELENLDFWRSLNSSCPDTAFPPSMSHGNSAPTGQGVSYHDTQVRIYG